jgi:hypothetical protein
MLEEKYTNEKLNSFLGLNRGKQKLIGRKPASCNQKQLEEIWI